MDILFVMKKYKPIDLTKIKTYPLSERKNKVNSIDFASIYKVGMSFKDFIKTLPRILKGSEIIELAQRIATAVEQGRNVIVMMGAHVIKCGLSPIIIDAIESGIINAIALNGACVIHDFEIAYLGQTSEDVGTNIADGKFGMAEETGKIINNVFRNALKTSFGAGKAISSFIRNSDYPYKTSSILYAAECYQVPVTVHIAIGTDIIHQHPVCDGAALGSLSLRDFRLLASILTDINDGGVVLNFGSAVMLPEVFIKALNLARNTGNEVKNFYTANFDMYQHYRPTVNILNRPVLEGGKSYNFVGHHEIMIPLLFGMVKEFLNKGNEE